MIIYVAFDDTNSPDSSHGTGLFARDFALNLPKDCTLWAVVQQQLYKNSDIKFTSHNSGVCCVINAPNASFVEPLIQKASLYIKKHFVEGSNPGLCVAAETSAGLDKLIRLGLESTQRLVTQDEAKEAAVKVYLSGHGGNNNGIIGAAAALGLTFYGESGRVIEYQDIRNLPKTITAGELRKRRIFVVSANRHAEYIPNNHNILTEGGLRPRLFAGRLTLPVLSVDDNTWCIIKNAKA